MPKYSTAFGMDVHLRSATVCALDADTGEAVTRRFPGNPWGEIAGWMDGFPGPCYRQWKIGQLRYCKLPNGVTPVYPTSTTPSQPSYGSLLLSVGTSLSL